MTINKKHVFFLFFCVLFFAYQYGFRSSIPNVLNEDLQYHFNVGTSKIGLLVSLFYLIYTVLQIPVGIIIDSINIKKIAVFSFSAYSIGLALFVSTSNFNCAAIIQMLLGAFASFSFILIMKVCNDYFPKEKVALIAGIATSIASLGPVICSPMLAYLSSEFPWIQIILFFGVLGVICAILGDIIIKEKDLIKPDFNTEIQTPKRPMSINSIISQIKEVLADYRFIMIGIFSMTILGTLSSFCDAWGISFITRAYGISRQQASFAVSFTYAGTIIGGPSLAYLAERLNNFKSVIMTAAIFFCFVVSIISFVRLPLPVLYATLFAMGVLAACQFLIFPVALSLGRKSIGATITGVVNSVTMLGCTILIWAFGYILDFAKGSNPVYSISDYEYGMAASVISVMIGIIFLAFTKLPKPKKDKNTETI